MKNTDKFLTGIVVGIIVLVVAAFVVTLTREPTYQPDDTPKGAAHNYLLALQKEDYARAYRYLSPTLDGYPTAVDEFTEAVTRYSWKFRLDTDTTLTVESSRKVGNRTMVQVRESRFEGGNLIGNNQSITTFDIELELEEGAWKIVDANYYFAGCWKSSEGCR